MAQDTKLTDGTEVLLFTESQEMRRRLAAAVAASRAFVALDFARTETRGRPPTQSLRAGILDIGDGGALDDPVVERFREALSGAPLIVVSQSLSPDRTRQLLRLGAADWLQEPFDDAEVSAMLGQLSQTGKAGAVVATFIPASGGAGATTMALLAAGILLRNSKTTRISVVDLDFQAANCAAYLNSPNEFDIGAVVENPERLDAELIALMKKDRGGRLALYSYERPDIGLQPKSSQFALRMLDICATTADVLLIDLPNLRTPWFPDVVRHSDLVFVVGELNVPSLGRTRRIVSEISALRGGSAGVEVIINKAEFKLFGNIIARKDVERALGRTEFHMLPDDAMLNADAINRGLLLSDLGPRSRLVRDANTLFGAAFRPKLAK